MAAADARSGSRATSSRRRWSRSAPAIGSRPTAVTPRSSCALYRAGAAALRAAADAETEGLRDLCAAATICAARAPRRATASQAAAAPRPHLPRRARTPGRQMHRALGRPPAPRRSARAARARADADPSRRPRAPARRARRRPRADRRAASAGREQVQIADALPRHLDPHRARADRRDRRLRAASRTRASSRRCLGLTPSEYSSGDQHHRGHITKTGNRHARRLLVEAAWHYRHRTPPPARRPASPTHAPGRPRSACTTATATSPSAASARPSPPSPSPASSPASSGPRMTDQPTRARQLRRRLNPRHPCWGRATGATARRTLDSFYAIPTRDPSARQLTTGHCPAVPTRASQSDSRPRGCAELFVARRDLTL